MGIFLEVGDNIEQREEMRDGGQWSKASGRDLIEHVWIAELNCLLLSNE